MLYLGGLLDVHVVLIFDGSTHLPLRRVVCMGCVGKRLLDTSLDTGNRVLCTGRTLEDVLYRHIDSAQRCGRSPIAPRRHGIQLPYEKRFVAVCQRS